MRNQIMQSCWPDWYKKAVREAKLPKRNCKVCIYYKSNPRDEYIDRTCCQGGPIIEIPWEIWTCGNWTPK